MQRIEIFMNEKCLLIFANADNDGENGAADHYPTLFQFLDVQVVESQWGRHSLRGYLHVLGDSLGFLALEFTLVMVAVLASPAAFVLSVGELSLLAWRGRHLEDRSSRFCEGLWV